MNKEFGGYKVEETRTGLVFGEGFRRILLLRENPVRALLLLYCDDKGNFPVPIEIEAKLKGYHKLRNRDQRDCIVNYAAGFEIAAMKASGKQIRKLIRRLRRVLDTPGDLEQLMVLATRMTERMSRLMPLLRPLSDYIESRDDVFADKRLADLISELKAARCLRQKNTPRDENDYDRFLKVACTLTRELGRPPFMGEVAVRFKVLGYRKSAAYLRTLANKTGLRWLKRAPIAINARQCPKIGERAIRSPIDAINR